MTTENTHDEQRDVDTFVAEHFYEPEANASSTTSTMADSTEAEGQARAQQETYELGHIDTATSSDNAPAPEPAEASLAVQATEAKASSALPRNEQGSVQEPGYSAPVSTPTQEVSSSVPTAEVTEEQQNTPSLEANSEQHTIVASGSEVASPQPHSDAHQEPEQPGSTEAATIGEPVTVEPLLAEPAEAVLLPGAATPQEESVATQPTELPPVEALPLIEAQIAEVRPFTSFLEEFEAQEARIKEAQAQALSLLHTAQIEEPATPLTPPEEMGGAINSFGTIDAAEGVAAEEAQEIAAETMTPAAGQTEEVTAALEQPVAELPEAIIAPKPFERPVSPLLRPALRPRVPRHGMLRQREEIAPIENTAAAQTEPAPVAPVEPEAPRPQRRYRFDNRPSSVNGGATTGSTAAPPATQPRVEDNKEKEAPKPSARNDSGLVATDISSETALKQGTNDGSAHEQPEESITAKQPASQEIVEEIPTQPSPISEQDRRRRHGQERPREKEQPAAQAEPAAPATSPKTVADIAALIEPETPSLEAVAPEDMPPLEYAELQKASSRRRRRHRSAPVTSAAAVSPPITPAAQPTQPSKQVVATPTPETEQAVAQVVPPTVTTANAPRSISTPAPSSSQYGVVSGYTVSQMNQSSNETIGPFMGPEPSPARGSVITRDGRTTRAESQRTPVYPVARTAEPTVSSTSIQQLASVLAQSIQTQSDRMVAELRRANQAPTNVSVNLPPFPSTERVGVFVDVANLLYSARTLRIAVDFGKLLDFLRGNRRLVRAHAYCPTSPQAGDEQMFLQAVKGLGYRITTKNYKTFSSGAKKADLDLDLCMDVVRLVDGRSVDCIVLVSGDSDFMPMLDYCSDHGVRVEVAAFDEAMSATLRQSCDLFINLSMLEEIRA